MPGSWGDPSWGNQNAGASPASQDPTRNENVYALRDNDTPQQWAQRVWAQSTADYGRNNLNPYTDQNPMANSPFAKWYQSRYGTAAPTNTLTNSVVNNTPMTSQNVANSLSGLQQSGNIAQAQGGAGSADLNQSKQFLHQVGSMLSQYGAGNKGGMGTFQQGMMDKILNDPALSTQMIMSGLQAGTGGWGMDYMGQRLSNLANHYYNDPANQGPEQKGAFFNQALQLLGI